MTNAPSWTPASRGGLIPLHPLGFGTVLGKSFGALRGNPKVLLGFAIGLQMAAGVILATAVGAISFWAYSRLDTVSMSSADYRELEAGAAVITGGSAVVLGLAVGALAIIVQAVVVGEVSFSALGEKATFGRIWARVKGRIWTLVGYTLLMSLALIIVVAIVAAMIAFFSLTEAGPVLGVIALLLGIPGGLVLFFWLYTKLYVVTPTIVLERAGVFHAISRSWTLTKGRFWPTFGIYILLSLILGTAGSVVSYPLMFLGMMLGTIIAPTGGAAGDGVMFVFAFGLSMIGSFLVQCVTAVVVSTSSALVYLDLRMRREGIDMKMQRYVESRDAGSTALDDPYVYDPNDVAPPRATFGYGYPAPGFPVQGAPGYAQQGAYGYQPQGPYAAPGQQAGYGQQAPYRAPGVQPDPYAAPGTSAAPYGRPPQQPYPPQAPPVPPYAPPREHDDRGTQGGAPAP
ncbi:glycerophosphoryl diester phosphodiesterase membrane domain-containing protein [Microbacterium halotolerans]|uniref:glycerophosphoryl diester phosphodiesterase membrane domain-containing protein n=1 Tax=Microbacterium halotolerans TaxID=246613 RepID=UPI0013C328D4|nr:glycerophosphoryl diester phosphodiesterase membrane domain-containing protein [Microbacterium halotolerans]